MLIRITESELVSCGFSLTDREEWFIAVHPEWKGKTKELLGTYLTCQSDRVGASPVAFEEAFAHVQMCGWCRSHLAHHLKAIDAAVVSS